MVLIVGVLLVALTALLVYGWIFERVWKQRPEEAAAAAGLGLRGLLILLGQGIRELFH
ncbi:hypothetical protein [Deinococcus sedimenti]|uniref:hypothetical protein n=1 Tax=Deinococcus sedimenti TaxID=1867090 RepID=UPI00166BF727|nr:hypothetical protein [Deinococcus sedimenti]